MNSNPNYCPTCNLTFCDCPPPLPPLLRPVRPLVNRQISNVRSNEIDEIIKDVQSGKLSKADALILYREIQEKMRIEIKQMNFLSTLVIEGKKQTFDDFPLP